MKETSKPVRIHAHAYEQARMLAREERVQIRDVISRAIDLLFRTAAARRAAEEAMARAVLELKKEGGNESEGDA